MKCWKESQNFVEHFFQDKPAFSQIIRTGVRCPFPTLDLMSVTGEAPPEKKKKKKKEDADEFYFFFRIFSLRCS